MTLLEIQLTIQQIFQLLGKPLEMSLEQYNNYLRMAQDELFKEFAHGYMSGNGAVVDSRVESAIGPFRDNSFVAGTASTYGGMDAYSYVIHADIYIILSAFLVYNTVAHPNKIKHVDIILDNEFSERFSNAITYPQTDYPIGVYDKSDARLYIWPFTATAPSLNMIYLKRPTTPILIETITDGVRTQHSSSTALQLDAMFHVDVIRKILQYLGVSIGNEFIATVAQQQQNLEK